MVIRDGTGKEYHSVEIQLESVLIPKERIETTPSSEDGIDADTENELRNMGAELIQKAGIYLELPQVAIASAQVLFQRFFYAKSFVSCDMQTAAKASIWLASKVEESVRRVRDVINVFNFLENQRDGKSTDPIPLDQNYWAIKREVIKMENRILAELGFCVHVQHPHKIIIMYLEILGNESKALVRTAWNYMNDSFRTTVFCEYQPETIACACIFLAARMLKIPLPTDPHWYTIFDASTKDVEKIALTILRIYSTVPRPYPELISKVEVIREAKKKHLKQNASLNNSPIVTSGSASPAVAKPDSPKVEKESTEKKKSKDRSRSRSRTNRHHDHDRSKDRHRHRDSRDNRNSSSKHKSRSKRRSRSRSRDRRSNSRDNKRHRDRRDKDSKRSRD